MTTYRNPYYDDPFLASIASNITKAFVDRDPGRTEANRASARLHNTQADEIDARTRGRSRIAGIFRNAKGQSIAVDQNGEMVAAGIEGGLKPDDVSSYNLMYTSTTGQAPSAVARAFVGTGKTIGKGDGVTLEDREAVAKRDNDAAAQRSAISAGPGYAAVAESRRHHDAELGFKERTRFDKPDHVTEGAAIYPNPDDTRYKGVAPGSIPAPKADKFVVSPNGEGGGYTYQPVTPGLPAPTPSSERDRFVQSEDPSNPGKNVYSRAREGLAGPTPKPPTEKAPRDISPNEVSDMEHYALRDVGAVDQQGVQDEEFLSVYAPKIPAAREAAAKEYQATGSAAAGQAAYLRALGIEPGSKWSGTSAVGRLFNGSKPGFQPRAGAAPAAPAPATPSPARPAAPTPAAPAAPAGGGLPPAAASRLKEGTNTQFGNGQVWTLRNGAPVQVK